MEEILASIRRILNEEPAADDAAAPAADPDDGVLVLDKSMMLDPSGEPQAGPAEGQEAVPQGSPQGDLEDMAQTEPADDAAPADPSPAVDAPVPGAPDLVAPEAAAAAATAMGTLMRTLAADRRPKVWAEGPTLEDMVRATLRPLLKEWLDTNLPPIVERLVRAEIERVVGRVIP
ncbi:MAG TPA: DUF2497 domain-containing protein [Rhodopila sp.]|uniref:DUF2497 domain-containing protein n=1 Tax=Rhodopila sp. TaxID=2480087 RepID=UPI002BECBC78|nr:DUF2497 domain-containing protein [Rhodopila sp.]HVY13880.1 DUF2497 domain-containing protein [Rhodopila sp.]